MAGNSEPPSSDSSDSSSLLDMENEDGWEDLEPDTENTTFISLFDGEYFDRLRDMLDYCSEKYHFNFVAVCSKLGNFTTPSTGFANENQTLISWREFDLSIM
jgi:hypothetical protein